MLADHNRHLEPLYHFDKPSIALASGVIVQGTTTTHWGPRLDISLQQCILGLVICAMLRRGGWMPRDSNQS
jgi:hypothetical protein